MKMKSGKFRIGVAITFLAAITLNFSLLSAQEKGEAAEPEERTWTSKSGHAVEATLVKFSADDLTLEMTNGKEQTIKRSLMSKEDNLYLDDFPSLKTVKLPWVRVQAKTKANSRKGRSGGIEERSKTMEISVHNRGKDPVDVEVVYGFLVEDLSGKSARQRQTREKDLYKMEFTVKPMKLEGQKELKFETAPISTTEITYGDTKGGSKANSFIVQVYWDGKLVDGWAADANLAKMAKDGTLLKKYRGR